MWRVILIIDPGLLTSKRVSMILWYLSSHTRVYCGSRHKPLMSVLRIGSICRGAATEPLARPLNETVRWWISPANNRIYMAAVLATCQAVSKEVRMWGSLITSRSPLCTVITPETVADSIQRAYLCCLESYEFSRSKRLRMLKRKMGGVISKERIFG